MSKDYKCFDNQKIEDSIFKVKASMNRLQNAIDYKTNYSEKNIFNSNQNFKDSISTYSKLSDNSNNNKPLFYNYLNNSKKLNNKVNQLDNSQQILMNNSHLTDIKTNRNSNFAKQNIYQNTNTNTNKNIINQNQPKKFDKIYNNQTYNNIHKKNYNLKSNQLSYNNNSKTYKSNIYHTNINKPKNVINMQNTINPYNTNPNKNYKNNNINFPSKIMISEPKNDPKYFTKKNINKNIIKNVTYNNTNNLSNLYKYGEYLTQELKMSNDANSELLENYINLSSKLKSKKEENQKINNKIKKLTEEEQKLNKANQDLKQNFSNVQKIIENNILSKKNEISEAQKNIDLKQNKIMELNETNINLVTQQKIYENEIKELEKIISDYNTENIDEKYEMNDILQNGKDRNVENGKDILNEIEEIKLRNTILKKEIDQLEAENMNLKNIKDIIINNAYNNNSNAYNDDISKYEYEEEIIGKNIKEYENKNEQFIKQVYDLKNEIELKNNIIDEMKNEINDINKNIIEIENKKNIKNEYFILRNKNEDNLKKLNALNDEIKKLLLSKEQYINEYDNEIKKLNELYNDKKEKIFIESIDNETKTLIEENEKIKNENDNIIQSLNDLPDLNSEYEKLNQINAKLKEELNKMQQK